MEALGLSAQLPKWDQGAATKTSRIEKSGTIHAIHNRIELGAFYAVWKEGSDHWDEGKVILGKLHDGSYTPCDEST